MPATHKPPTRKSRSLTRQNLKFRVAVPEDVAKLAALHAAVAEHLTARHGHGVWSSRTTEKGVLYAMRHSQVFVLTDGATIIATFRLATRKPWAIDTSYFTKCEKPLYLLAMAVAPEKQRKGLGRKCLAEAERIARKWPADAIRLDAYDAQAGGGPFYQRCAYAPRGKATYRNVPLLYYELLLTKSRPL
jgi:GNAT superfamily N-acetyltransferase